MHCDLHMHSTASDGTDAPSALAAIARSINVSAIALTDHDTTEGLPACAAACAELGIDFVPGIELSCDPHAKGLRPPRDTIQSDRKLGTLHILGFFVDPGNARLLDIHHRILRARLERNPQIIRNLQGLGVEIEYDEVLALAAGSGTKIVGRPHIAQVLVKKGYARSAQDAFAKYIGEGRPAYCRRDTLTPSEAIEAIHDAGGLASLAHPIQLRYADDAELEFIMERLRDAGLDAVEVRHCDHTPPLVEQYTQLAQRLGLLVSGGSDYHGSRKSVAMGSSRVPRDVFETLRERHTRFSGR
ncbi:MAG: PHP domain-containing protein [Planctomycetes bacterium]|nr:PHP domain-containing protein [Planctomycetota bacterium]